jgi:hypothetical protein
MVRFLCRLFIAAVLFHCTAFAADISIKASAQQKEGTVGEVTAFVFNVTGWETLTVKLPEPKIIYPEKNAKNTKDDDPSLKVPLCEISDFRELDSKDTKEKLYEMKVIFYHTGMQSMPKAAFVDKDGVEVGYNIPQINIKAVNEQNQLADIEPPVSLKGNYYRLIWLIAGVVLAAVLITALVIYLHKRRKNRIIPVPEISPFEVFNGDITALKGSDLIDTDAEQYIISLSMIFRRFISKLFSINAVDMTDDEIVNAIINGSAKRERYDVAHQMRDLMSPWNLAKFAELIPPKEILEENLTMVEKMALELHRRYGG